MPDNSKEVLEEALSKLDEQVPRFREAGIRELAEGHGRLREKSMMLQRLCRISQEDTYLVVQAIPVDILRRLLRAVEDEVRLTENRTKKKMMMGMGF